MSAAERAEFGWHRKYHGAFARVARSLRMHPSNVIRVARIGGSVRIMAAIRAEMALVDAELASKSGDTPLERAFGKQLIAHDLAAAARHLDRIRGGRA
jgi:hypothetical protein